MLNHTIKTMFTPVFWILFSLIVGCSSNPPKKPEPRPQSHPSGTHLDKPLNDNVKTYYEKYLKANPDIQLKKFSAINTHSKESAIINENVKLSAGLSYLTSIPSTGILSFNLLHLLTSPPEIKSELGAITFVAWMPVSELDNPKKQIVEVKI